MSCVGRHDVVVAGQDDRHAGCRSSRACACQPLEPCELVIELRARLRIAVRQVDRGDRARPSPPPRCSAPAVSASSPGSAGASRRAPRRAPGSRRRSSFAARSTPPRSRRPRSAFAGNDPSSALSSCRQTMSGCSTSQPGRRFASRLLMLLMLKVAIFMRRGVTARRQRAMPEHARRPPLSCLLQQFLRLNQLRQSRFKPPPLIDRH